jgi:hypothetical protein
MLVRSLALPRTDTPTRANTWSPAKGTLGQHRAVDGCGHFQRARILLKPYLYAL